MISLTSNFYTVRCQKNRMCDDAYVFYLFPFNTAHLSRKRVAIKKRNEEIFVYKYAIKTTKEFLKYVHPRKQIKKFSNIYYRTSFLDFDTYF